MRTAAIQAGAYGGKAWELSNDSKLFRRNADQRIRFEV